MTKNKFIRGMRRGALIGAVVVVGLALVALGLLLYVSKSMADEYLRQKVVSEIGKITGTRVELGRFHVDPWHLRVTLADFTIHGRESAGSPPFFYVERLEVGMRIDSFWGHKVSVGDVEIVRPLVNIRIARDGSSNVPIPPGNHKGKPIRERLFEVVVHRLRLDDGEIAFNDRKIPVAAQGGRLNLAVDYSDIPGRQYIGDFRWQRVTVAARSYRPFPSDIGVRFTLEPDSLTVTQLLWTAAHTNLDAQFTLANFAHPSWSFRYRGRLGLEDLQMILRKPKVPSGRVDFNGNGKFAEGKLAVTGGYSASEIGIRDPWFHVGGMSSRGDYHADRNVLTVPDLRCDAMGGFVTGRLQLQLHGLRFRVDAHAQGVNLPQLLAGVNNPNFPVTLLHWDAAVDVQSVVTWLRDFRDVDAQGVATWQPHEQTPPRLIPVHATLNYHYNMLQNGVTLQNSQISTPSSLLQIDGMLTAHGTGMTATFDAQDLVPWDDFINHLRGASTKPKLIAGNFHWQGRMSGPLTGPTFTGHVRGTSARYDQLYWDEIEGNMNYSPDGFSLTGAQARRGRSSAQLEISLALDDWNFRPESPWSFNATLVRTDMSGLQSLLGYSFPVGGQLSGQFNGKGTRADPMLDGLFDVISPEAWGWKFDRFRGALSWHHGEVRVFNAELRLPPPPNATASAAPGLLTGNFLYNTDDAQVMFNLTGAALPLEGVSRLQTARLKMGGRLNFQVSGDGPLLAPKVQGSLRLVNLRLNSSVIGSFAGRLESDGAQLMLQVDSAMSTGALHGTVNVSLHGDYPISSQISIMQIDLNPLLAAALHLPGISGTGEADGQFTLSGSLLNPQSLDVRADLTHLVFDFQYVKVENQGPVRLDYGHNEVQVEQANFRGTDTDFHLSGMVRFAADRRVAMQLGGQLNLSVLSGFVSGLDARGPAQVNASIAGTLSSPRVTGRVHLQNASFRYGDFPAGLSQVGGDMVFDTNRLVFDNLTATTGGGQLRLGGAVSYGNGPVRYDLTLRSDQVRVRYPMGMSWLAGGSLQLAGTTQSATLSGTVTVDRLLLADNFDVVTLLASSTDAVSAPTVGSPFLQNLQFNVQAMTSPNARLEWSSGSSQAQASLRVRGTWERPIFLGDIQLLNGTMNFRGNRYQLSRGEINFVNPFRLEPQLDIEATTKIREYEVTVDFTGAASHLTMSYRSDPPLPSSDIITLLALGQTGEATQLRGVTPVETPEVGATTLLSEAISSQLGTRIQRLFGISRFSLDPSYLDTTTSTQNPAARITVEQQFTGNLTVLYSTDVTSTQEEVIQIEYSIRPDLSVVALRDDNGTFGVDIIRRKRFK